MISRGIRRGPRGKERPDTLPLVERRARQLRIGRSPYSPPPSKKFDRANRYLISASGPDWEKVPQAPSKLRTLPRKAAGLFLGAMNLWSVMGTGGARPIKVTARSPHHQGRDGCHIRPCRGLPSGRPDIPLLAPPDGYRACNQWRDSHHRPKGEPGGHGP